MFRPFPFEKFYSFLKKEPFYILLESLISDPFRSKTILFYRPERFLFFRSKDSWKNFVKKMNSLQKEGYFLSVMADYECGYLFNDLLVDGQWPSDKILLIVVACKRPLIFDHFSGKFSHDPSPLMDVVSYPEEEGFWIEDVNFALDQKSYIQKIQSIQKFLKKGHCYQVNFTDFLRASFRGCPIRFYSALKKQQPVGYAGLIKNKDKHILSLSPELFFRMNKRGHILMKPMKGTASQKFNGDSYGTVSLDNDPKNRSENLMIVDLLRNDLGKVCSIGSISVKKLCEIELYKTITQMTSTISGWKKKDLSVWDVFYSLFPSGSITGAPKIETMKIIRSIENNVRGLYTGTMGWISPNGSAIFNVCIRTIEIYQKSLSMGVGSGIVFESNAKQEYEECFLKTVFLRKAIPRFRIIETLLWKEGSYQFLDQHLKRLKNSAQYFSFECDVSMIRNVLQDFQRIMKRNLSYKVSLRLNSDGILKCRSIVLKPSQKEPFKIDVSPLSIDSQNPFLYHKTTCRNLYRQELSRIRKEKGCFDLLFFNEHRFLCEGSISNVYLKKGRFFLTPPPHVGLLNGVFRQHLLETQSHIREKNLMMDDLFSADEIYVSNSIIGLKKAKLVTGGFK